MKTFTLTLLMGLTAIASYGQDKKDLMVSVSAGKLTSPYYSGDKAKGFYAIDFDYYLSKRHVLSANFNAGEHDYYDNQLSNTTGSIKNNGSNAKATYRTFSILYKYRFVQNKFLSGNIGGGAGMMTHSRLYPYTEGNSTYYRQSTWTDLVFPVKLELDYKLSDHFQLGITGGFYIQPDYPILAYYAGPRFSYLLK